MISDNNKCDLVVHGVGCPKTGGLVILSGVVEALGVDRDVGLWVSSAAPSLNWAANFTKIVPAKVANGFLRVIWEVWFGVAASKYYHAPTLNLSNYGFSVGGWSVVMIHSPEILLTEFADRNFGSRLKDVFLRWTLSMADCVVLQTAHMEAALHKYSARIGSRVPPVLRYIPQIGSRAASHHKGASKLFRLFYPASNFSHKRIDLCESVALDGNIADCELTVANSRLNKLNFKGLGAISHDEVMSRFATSDALLFTSELETLGLPLLEALSFGLPAVLPKLPYATEIYGDAAVYFERFDPLCVAAAIDHLRSNYDTYANKASLRRDQLIMQGNNGVRNLIKVMELANGVVL